MSLYTTTAAKRRQLGQSMIEFAFMVPLIVSLLMFMREANMAINASIVNQKYARSTLHFLLFNHRWYPEQKFVKLTGHGTFMHRWWVGVEQDRALGDDDGTEGKPPVASTILIGHTPGQDDKEHGLPVAGRQNVRIRTMSFICLPPFGNKLGYPYSQGAMPNSAFLDGQGFQYCAD